jgi:hypothetical protein
MNVRKAHVSVVEITIDLMSIQRLPAAPSIAALRLPLAADVSWVALRALRSLQPRQRLTEPVQRHEPPFFSAARSGRS